MLNELCGYLVVRVIGSGAQSTVYLARSRNSTSPVALKVVDRSRVESAAVLERFEYEARIAAALMHPNIVRVLDAGSRGSLMYMAMEFVEGEDLAHLLRRKHRLPPRETAGVLGPIAAALDHAHSRGVLHMDVKPSNILIRRDGTPMLADFGVARAVGRDGRAEFQDFAGTPEYASPEQARGHGVVDGRSDVYSLGAVAYEMLSGHPPFVADSPLALLRMQVEAAPRPLKGVLRGVGTAVEGAVMRALAKDPNARFANCADLVSALRGRQPDAPVNRLPQPTRSRAARPRHKAAYILALGLLLAAAVVAVLALPRARRLPVVQQAQPDAAQVLFDGVRHIARRAEAGFGVSGLLYRCWKSGPETVNLLLVNDGVAAGDTISIYLSSCQNLGGGIFKLRITISSGSWVTADSLLVHCDSAGRVEDVMVYSGSGLTGIPAPAPGEP